MTSESNFCGRSRSGEQSSVPTYRHFGSVSRCGEDHHPIVPSSPAGFLARAGLQRLHSKSFPVLALSVIVAAQVAAQQVEDSQVKAAYLYNFAKFVEWPAARFQHPDDPVVICILGDERTTDVLEHSIPGRKANGRSIQAVRPRTGVDLASCHILFIGFSDKRRVTEALRQMRGLSVLTVGQNSDFMELGGMINLAPRDGTIELEINPEKSNLVGLKISSRLLIVARIVSAKGAQGG